ncbi:cbb3-type cytochrome c oxidase subunit III [Fluviicoccus keumensis]|uniref:Cbb3-type cytochrome c oxidase subunit III n=1 Tax=Fluviicoccus keumensis TaxID=1435465 RepID=A0A4V2G616_9GAMM|nr:c-type cytochrome [Fluviicoccus keumensis]RZU46936.1 cbb3-type cytochrome c oxidase subunit III [Fluviicoccus keumensis]
MKKSLLALTALGVMMASGFAAAADRNGEAVFKAVCTTCHTAGLMNAPKFGDKAAWAPRIAQGKPTLYSHALAGIRMMPAKGTCANCTEGEIKAAVDYMVSKAK